MKETTAQKPANHATAAMAVRMYPSNTLKQQVRDPKDNLSAFKVLKDAFLVKK